MNQNKETTEFWRGFFHPPKDCAQTPFWFLNGEVDGEVYAAQMDEMARKGVWQAMPHPRYGMDRREYLTEHYFEAFEKMAENAREKGYRIHLYDEFNWSSGNAGGRITAQAKNCALGIAMGAGRTDGTFRYEGWEEGFMGWGRMEGILAAGYAPYRSETEIDFSRCRFTADYTCEDGRFCMETEPGDWMAFVIYTVRTIHPSPLRQGNGGIVDYLNPKVTERFICLTHEAYFSRLGEFFGETIPSIFYDEASPYACGNFTWTEGLPEVFLEKKGYDILEKLPLLFLDGGAETARVRCDYWDVATGIFAEGFVGQLAEWCGAHGIALTGHTHEDSGLWPVAGNLFRTLRAQQWPGLDSLMGYKPYSALKPAVSAAHVAGRDMVVCEALGLLSDGWECTPEDMKKAYNQLAVAGVNLLIPHGFFETVENPKAECPPSFFTCNPYWDMYGEISARTALQCYVNRKTAHVSDVALFYPIVSWQAGGRGGRGRTFPWGIEAGMGELTRGEWEAFDRIVDGLMGEQLDMDVLDDAALAEGRMDAGGFTVGRETYRVLVLPPMSAMRLADAGRILELAEGGLPVLASEGFAPVASADRGAGDPELGDIMERLHGYLRRFQGIGQLAEQIRELTGPDILVVAGPRETLDAAHRRRAGVDFYLLSHTGGREQDYRISVGCRGRDTALLDCRGQRHPAQIWGQGERTEVRFLAEPEELYYFVLAQEEVPGAGPAEDAGGAAPGIGGGSGSAEAEGMDGTWDCFSPWPEGKSLVEEIGHFRFLPWPKGLDGAGSADSFEELDLPVCRTLPLSYESGDGERLAAVWRHWMEPGFDDSAWEVISLKHGPKLYNHTGSRLFRFTLPVGTAAVRRPIPARGEYALYLNGRLVEAVTGFAREIGEDWIPVEGCGERPGILAIESSSMMPQFGVAAPIAIRILPVETRAVDWEELGLSWYAGYGRYEAEFDWQGRDGEDLWLDLGQVRECAAVFLNGRSLGRLLWKPYRLELSRAARRGRNKLTIYCCNLIANEFAWDPLGTRGSASALPSGLLGPVRLWRGQGPADSDFGGEG